jgi:arylsulfate sulfotransferase
MNLRLFPQCGTRRDVLRWSVVGFVLVLFGACGDDPAGTEGPDLGFLTDLRIVLNPFGYTPLTAEVSLTTDQPLQVEVVVARVGTAGDPPHRFGTVTESARLPVLGLYPDAVNTITLRFFDEGGALLGDTVYTYVTPPLMAELPAITINAAVAGAMTPGMNLVSYYGHTGEVTPQRPFIFDATGTIRWYLDLRNHPNLGNLFYDDGIERLANGNLFFGDLNSGRILEMDMVGRIVNEWPMPGYGFHHHVLEKRNGNFVATVNKHGVATVEDYLIEIDRVTGDILREWNLNQSLEYGRRAWPTAFGDIDVDWFHGNGLAYDPADDAIIVSGRTQGTVKLTNDNQVVWILAPHRDWGTAGDGTDLTTKLLQPLDAAGQPITDPAVLDGSANHPEFEWAWYQHAPELLPDGTLLLFDNGDNRNYVDRPLYSRAVLYRIDDKAMTVQQLWDYGTERGEATFSRIVSDVDYHPDEGNVMFMPGAVGVAGRNYGKMVEVDYVTRDVVFEATITPPESFYGITFHRVERLSLYP